MILANSSRAAANRAAVSASSSWRVTLRSKGLAAQDRRSRAISIRSWGSCGVGGIIAQVSPDQLGRFQPLARSAPVAGHDHDLGPGLRGGGSIGIVFADGLENFISGRRSLFPAGPIPVRKVAEGGGRGMPCRGRALLRRGRLVDDKASLIFAKLRDLARPAGLLILNHGQ